MGINARQLRDEVVGPVLRTLSAWSLAAENLMLGTAAVESDLGHFIRQVGHGPALGIYQMEPATHQDIHENYLKHRPELREFVMCWAVGKGLASEMVWNLAYATAMARVHYLRVKEPLPPSGDIPGLGAYYKQYYNTNRGKGSAAGFVAAYMRRVQA